MNPGKEKGKAAVGRIMLLCSLTFCSSPRSEGWPHHGRTFSVYLCPLSFWLTLPRRVLSTSWCCPSRPCVAFLAYEHLALNRWVQPVFNLLTLTLGGNSHPPIHHSLLPSVPLTSTGPGGCRFPGLAVSSAKILVHNYLSATIYRSNFLRQHSKLLWFEITKMPTAV